MTPKPAPFSQLSLPIILEFLLFPFVATLEKLEIKRQDGKTIASPLDVGRSGEILPGPKINAHAAAPPPTAVPPSAG